MPDIKGLTDAEYEEFKNWTREKRDHYARLLAKIERSYSSPKQGDLPIAEQTTIVASNGEVVNKIVSVMSARRWMKNQAIRVGLKDQHGVDLSRGRLREYLAKNEGIHFQKRGNRGSSEWKLIQSDSK
jgi:hypothetical protein